MKCRLPILTSLLPGLVLGLCLRADGDTEPLTGQQLIQQAARNLAMQPSLEAKLRQRVTLFDQYLVGSGSYRQLIIGDRKMFRLELLLQMADLTGSLLQVCNGNVLWEKRDIGTIQSLGYANVQNIRDAVSRAGGRTLDSTHLALGGLDQLLRGLDASFDFGDPTPQQIRELPVWEIHGYWKPEKVSTLLPATAGSEPLDWDALPDHVPQRVTVVLGRDRPLPLFPYRIEYERRVSGKAKDSPDKTRQPEVQRPYRAIVTLELFEVQRYARMDPQHFAFQVPQTKADDLTSQILDRLNLQRTTVAGGLLGARPK